MKKKLQYLLLILLLAKASYSQLITWQPYFAKDSDSLTVIFDATKGNAGLMGYTGDVYAHTGVITNLSTQPSDWRYVKTNWGQNTPETRLERIGTNLYRFKIKPSVRSFYGVPSSEQILKVAFVFRSATQVGGVWLEGKTETGGDIFLPLAEPGVNVAIINPAEDFIFKELNDTIKVQAVSINSVSLSLYVDNNLVSQTSSTSLNYDIIINATGKKWVKAVAIDSVGVSKADSFYYVIKVPVQIQNLPNGIQDGINYTSSSTAVLSLYAPLKNFIYVIGSFNNWEVDPNYFMKMTPDSTRFWLELSGLNPGQEYTFQYLIDGNLKIADPYSEKVLDPWNDQSISSSTYPGLIPYPFGKTTEIVSVLQTNQAPYSWQNTTFQRPPKTDLVIYEILLRDFLSTHDYKTLHDTLNYLKNLGVNAIELMPINEFEGNESWGYNPSFHLAVDKYYGPKNDLKKFIDKAHGMGIAVILDIVLNHAFGQSPLVRMYATNNGWPSSQNPWLNPDFDPNYPGYQARHPYNVGYDFNHESQATKDFVDRVTRFWMTEYKVDGFRFDLTKGFTQKPSYIGNGQYNDALAAAYDQSRINNLKRIADKIWEIDSTFYVIFEHFTDNSEETVLANFGAMIWGNMNYQYNEATMGYSSNLIGTFYQSRGWLVPHLVAYMESHDEERLMYKNLNFGNSSGSYNIRNILVAINRIKLAAAFYFLIPGPKMIWQFGELGYDYSINYNGRLGKKPIRWDYFSDAKRLKLYKVFAEMIKLKKNYEIFKSGNYISSLFGYDKKMNITHPSMDAAILGNFNVTEMNITPSFSRTGKWYEYFSGDSIDVTDVNMQMTFQPGELRIYTTVKLPPPEPDLLTEIEEDLSETVPNNFELLQNYPNPFNPSTKIKFTLPGDLNTRHPVSLKIYDILGNEIATLVDEEKLAGSYEVEFNPAVGNSSSNRVTVGLASGIYYYQLKAGNFTETKKMVLIR